MNFSLENYKVKPLIAVVLGLSFLIDWGLLMVTDLIGYEGLIRVPGNISIIVLTLFVYNKWGWKIPILNFLVTVPDMSGRYEGKVKYNFKDQKGEKDCFMEVVQNASSIKVHTYFARDKNQELTESKSLVEKISKGNDGFYTINLLYLNSGTREDSSLDCHEGANILKFFPQDDDSTKRLRGHYFTNRKIQTKGFIEVEFKTKKLEGKF